MLCLKFHRCNGYWLVEMKDSFKQCNKTTWEKPTSLLCSLKWQVPVSVMLMSSDPKEIQMISAGDINLKSRAVLTPVVAWKEPMAKSSGCLQAVSQTVGCLTWTRMGAFTQWKWANTTNQKPVPQEAGGPAHHCFTHLWVGLHLNLDSEKSRLNSLWVHSQIAKQKSIAVPDS